VNESEKLFKKGVEAVKNQDSVSALAFFEKATELDNIPKNRSYLAFCIAKERGQFKKAISLCEEAMREEPGNSLHYLNLGRVYTAADQKNEAMRIYREGLKIEDNKQIEDELRRLGVRKEPPLPYLKRDNPINKYIGLILSKLGMR